MQKLLKERNTPIFNALRAYKGIFKSVAVFTAVMNILMLVPSIYMLEVYDRVLTSRNEVTLLALSLLMIFLYIIYGMLEGVRGQAVIKVGEALDARLNTQIYTAAFEENLRQKNINAGLAVNDLTTIRQFVTGSTLFSFFDAPWFPIYLIVIFVFNLWLGVFALISIALLITLAIANELLTNKDLTEASALSNQSSNLATNHLRNSEVIGSMGMLPAMSARWQAIHQQFLSKQSAASHHGVSISSTTRVIRLTLQSLVLGLAAYLVLLNQISPGMMIAASILLGRALAPVEQVIAGWRSFKSAAAAMQRLNKLLENSDSSVDRLKLPAPLGQIQVDNISAGPPGNSNPTIKQISFGLNPGDVLCIIGPSAAGKSTLARVILGIWPTINGTVRIDGADMHQIAREDIGPFIGYLPQDVELFAGTISENIARFNPIDAEKVVEAAQIAGVHDMILRLPQGYETKIGDSGVGLSGGQMQRIGLARALYNNPKLLVLDEPNSNLDENGEVALLRAINTFAARKSTTIVISHKMSMLQVASKILLLNDGQQQAFGPKDKILEALKNKQRTSDSNT